MKRFTSVFLALFLIFSLSGTAYAGSTSKLAVITPSSGHQTTNGVTVDGALRDSGKAWRLNEYRKDYDVTISVPDGYVLEVASIDLDAPERLPSVSTGEWYSFRSNLHIDFDDHPTNKVVLHGCDTVHGEKVGPDSVYGVGIERIVVLYKPGSTSGAATIFSDGGNMIIIAIGSAAIGAAIATIFQKRKRKESK